MLIGLQLREWISQQFTNYCNSNCIQIDEDLEQMDIEIKLAPENYGWDLSSAAPLNLAAKIRTDPATLAHSLYSAFAQKEKHSLGTLVDCLEPAASGYMNFRLTSNGVRHWLCAIFGLIANIDPDEKKILVQQNLESISTQKSSAIVDTRERCLSLLRAAASPRFDIENKVELSSLLNATQHFRLATINSAKGNEFNPNLLNSCISSLKETRLEPLSKLFGPDTARLIASIGLLVESLLATTSEKNSNNLPPLKRIINQAGALSMEMIHALSRQQLICHSNADITYLRLALMVATVELLPDFRKEPTNEP